MSSKRVGPIFHVVVGGGKGSFRSPGIGTSPSNDVLYYLHAMRDPIREIENELRDVDLDAIPVDTQRLLQRTYEDALSAIYDKLCSELPNYGRTGELASIRAAWSHPDRGFKSFKVSNFGGVVRIDSEAWENLRPAVAALRDAAQRQIDLESDAEEVLKSQEKARAADLAQKEELRRQDAEQKEADRALAKNGQDRQFANNLLSALFSAIVAALAVTKGSCSCAPTPPAVPLPTHVLEGALAGAAADALPDDAQVRCDPTVDGVLGALGPKVWSVTILPTSPAPTRLYCRVVGKGLVSSKVSVGLGERSLPVLVVDWEAKSK